MFYVEQDNKIIFTSSDKQTLENTLIFTPQYADLEIKESEVDIVEYEGTFYFVDNEEYLAKVAQKEKERIAKLNLTGADVERGIYQAKGMDFDDILAFVMANPPQGLDVKALRIELKANHFYRGNPYVNAVGALLGFTSEQLDKFFETNDYTTLLSQSDKVEGESDKVSDTVEEPVKDEV